MIKFTFRQVEAFYWAATLGTVAAAAKHLFVSQPAITARVKELEDILGLALLSRSQHGVQLTPTGRDVLELARKLLESGAAIGDMRANEQPPLDGLLRLGADESSAAVVISALLRQLRVTYPSLRVALSVERSKVLQEKLNRRELDVAIHTNPAARPHVIDEPLGRVDVAWVASGRLEGVSLPFRPADAAAISIVLNPPPSILHVVARDWLSEAGRDIEKLNTCNSLSTIMTMVQDQHAISTLPVPVVMDRVASGVLKLLEADPPLQPIAYYLSFLSERRSANVEAINVHIRQTLKETRFLADVAV